MEIRKRDGSLAEYDIGKIRAVVNWACAGKAVNPIALEAGLTTRLRPGITTREIQDNLINCALEMCSLDEPDWRYVAGRLHIWSLWKDTLVSRGYQYGNYLKTVRDKVQTGQYDARLNLYSERQLQEAGGWINPDWDLAYDYAGAHLLTSRYLLPDELPQEAMLTCALLLASVEQPENRLYWARCFYEAIAQRQISLATPILANLRVPGGSLSSCFILAIDDNLESIFQGITNTARISKNGGGVGANVSRIRATGSWVMGKTNASGGVIPWIKLLNDTAIAVNQGGKRAGAVTVSLDIWHLDVPEFLEMQAENGDQRRKCYDIFPQLVLPDEFMRRVVNKEEWTLVDPHEVRSKLGIELAELWEEKFELAYSKIEAATNDGTLTLWKRVNARQLFKTIMRAQIETGMPYLAFKDTINSANPNSHEGYIPGVNLCCESFSNVTLGSDAEEVHCCNLVSLNLALLPDSKKDIESTCTTAVRLLDNTIELTTPPVVGAKNHNDKYRTIGVGMMGLADWLALHSLQYQNLDEINFLFEQLSYYCTRASVQLAAERGAYPAYQGSGWQQGLMIGNKTVDDLKKMGTMGEKWDDLLEELKQHGIRNSHVTAIAPNTSSALLNGCTASILPTFSRFFIDKASKGAVPVAPPFVAESFWFYQENKNLDQQVVIEATAVIQRWIDTGISMELLFNLNEGIYHAGSFTAKDMYDALILAWKRGVKAIYYVRTVQKDNFKESEGGCTSCAN